MADKDAWTPAFEGQRPPLDGNVDGIETRFGPSNQLSVKHGGFSLLNLDGRVSEISEMIRERMGEVAHPRFDLSIQAAAVAGAKLERVLDALAAVEPDAVSARLEGEASRWWKHWASALDRLGMTPMAASKLGLNLALADDAKQTSLKRRAELEAEQARREAAGG